MGKERRIDSIFKRKRVECEAQETGEGEVPEPQIEVHETPVQPPLLLLEFGQQTPEEQGYQTHK
jgi:hypothetical protein